ncbi:MAG: serine hydrolase domain-containing protein [Candidatus Thermoplasmatota archaeon]|nr:serine hydrolase domain-containing protein [Candidatus Thermoplasmatota archaeon]
MGSRTKALALVSLMLISIVPAIASAHDDPVSLNDPFSELDSDISDLLLDWQVPGAQVAVMYNGSLVFNKGYGISSNGTDEGGNYWSSQVTVDSKFRIASLSKAITAAGILTLVQNGTISLDDRMVDLVPHLLPPELEGCDYPSHQTLYSIDDITVSMLLNHRAGFDRDGSPNSDPTYWHWNSWVGSWQNDDCIDKQSLIEDYDNGNLAPISMERILSEWLRRPLDFDPGSRYVYSNIGYQILGQIIEAETGMSYEEYIIESVLTPMGIESMSIGMTMPDQREVGEVSYFDDYTSWCHFPDGQDDDGDPIFPFSPGPDCGAFVIEEKDGGGGWIATASDYARFISHIDGTIDNEIFEDSFEFFTENSYDTYQPWYGSGVYVLSEDEQVWQHWGAFSGSSTNFRREVTDSGESVVFVMFTNTRPDGNWKSVRESVISDAMMAVDYSNTTPLEQDESDPLPPQDSDIEGSSYLSITGEIGTESQINATWSASITIREEYGTDLLPNQSIGLRNQIDLHLGNSDGTLDSAEVSAFASLVVSARSWIDSETGGCCSFDNEPMQSSEGTSVSVTPPRTGSVEIENGTWGWNESASLVAQADSRSTRLIDLPRSGSVIEEVPLTISLPHPWEFRYSAMQEIIEGTPSEFTVIRGQSPVYSDIRISIDENQPPSITAERVGAEGSWSMPLDSPTTYSASCTDSALENPSVIWEFGNNGTFVLEARETEQTIIPSELGYSAGDVVSATVTCTDSFSSTVFWYENNIVDGAPPVWYAHFTEVQSDGSQVIHDETQSQISVRSDSQLTMNITSTDDFGQPVLIEVTSNKSQGWRHFSNDELGFTDRFSQGGQINGMHLNVSERHESKERSIWDLSMTVTDEAGNNESMTWNVLVLDGSPPTIIPEIIAQSVPISPDNPARQGDEVILSLTESFDDIDSIQDLVWAVSLDSEILVDNGSWEDAEKVQLPPMETGNHLFEIEAWDSSGNRGSISFYLSVAPAFGIDIEVLQQNVIGEQTEGQTVVFIVTMQNLGATTASGRLCNSANCTDYVMIPGATATSTGVFSVELNVHLEEVGDYDPYFEWVSSMDDDAGVLEFEDAIIAKSKVVASISKSTQAFLVVLVVLTIGIWGANRLWGRDSIGP